MARVIRLSAIAPFYAAGFLAGALRRALALILAALNEGYQNGMRT